MGLSSTVVASLIGGGASLLSSIIGKDDSPAPVAPTPAPPTVMPTADDASGQAARKKSIMDQAQRQGRASTILTSEKDTSDKLGG
jgi:hypothetical protein